MKTFDESGFSFSFGSAWNVIKYDDHRYYKILSGHHMSGVDFAGIYNCEEVFLLEIKNFNQYKSEKSEKTIQELCQEITEKGRDTIQLINVIHKYLHKKLLYNAFYGLVKRFPWLNPEWVLWSDMHNLSIVDKKVNFVLLIDSDFDQKAIEELLSENLQSDFQKIIVLNLEEGELLPDLALKTLT